MLEIGAGTGYNAAVIGALGGEVTSVELQPEVADAARAHLAAAGARAEVVTGDGAHPPPGPFDRIVVTAGAWEIAPALAGALADGGILVAPLRLNAIEAVFALRRDGDRLYGEGALPCGFMPLRGEEAARPWRWRLGGGGGAMADADLGSEGRGNLDRLLAGPARDTGDPLAGIAQPMDALVWLALGGDPLLSLTLPVRAGGPAPWTLALDVLPASAAPARVRGRLRGHRRLAPVRRRRRAAHDRGGGGGVARRRAARGPRRSPSPSSRTATAACGACPTRTAPARRRCTGARTAGRCATPSARTPSRVRPVDCRVSRAHAEKATSTRRGAQRGTAIQVARPWA